jgi:hypothetical protein
MAILIRAAHLPEEMTAICNTPYRWAVQDLSRSGSICHNEPQRPLRHFQEKA